ncbi:amine oxidase [flavin-containing] B-like [Ischnura elegans]|uniref:amine oxidase [flavin-containing] B-like n=1 Tax=Ischnura elegans TaxID=197161 RepID=UPI001ED884CE|nr:amine oxidase [flavin-containing] B-like [Ischnura elegans]
MFRVKKGKTLHSHLAVAFSVIDSTNKYHGPALTGILTSNVCQYWSKKEAPERKMAILTGLSQIFGPQSLYPLDFAEKFWTGEPYIGSSSMHLAAVGTMEDYPILAECHGRRVYFAGSETANSWPGYMNGAVQAGQRAAWEIMYALSPNTVTPYEVHESLLKHRAAKFDWNDDAMSWLSMETNSQSESTVNQTSSEEATHNNNHSISNDEPDIPMIWQFLSRLNPVYLPLVAGVGFLIIRYLVRR